MNRMSFLAALAVISLGTAQAETHVGCPVRIDKDVEGSVRGAGCTVVLDASVDGSARLAGGRVEIGPNSTVSGNASLAGGDVAMKGTVKGSLQVGGGHVVIDGTVGDDASVGAGTLELGPNARIGGKLHFRGGTLEQDPAAQVTGGIDRARHHHWRDDSFMPLRESHGALRWIWTASSVLLAALFIALLPGYANRMTQELRAEPWMPPLFGFIALVCIPVAAVLVMVTIIGIPLGILAILGYLGLLIVGYVCTAVVTGSLLLERFNAEAAQRTAWRIGAAAATMLAIALLARIPVVGGLVAFVALIVGIGLIVATVLHGPRWRGTAA